MKKIGNRPVKWRVLKDVEWIRFKNQVPRKFLTAWKRDKRPAQ